VWRVREGAVESEMHACIDRHACMTAPPLLGSYGAGRLTGFVPSAPPGSGNTPGGRNRYGLLRSSPKLGLGAKDLLVPERQTQQTATAHPACDSRRGGNRCARVRSKANRQRTLEYVPEVMRTASVITKPSTRTAIAGSTLAGPVETHRRSALTQRPNLVLAATSLSSTGGLR
jgi:hypothetical protein